MRLRETLGLLTPVKHINPRERKMNFEIITDKAAQGLMGGSHQAWDPGMEGKGAIFAICLDDDLSSGVYAIVTPNGKVVVKDEMQFANGKVPASNNGQGSIVSSGLSTGLC